MDIIQKAIYRFSLHIKLTMTFFHRTIANNPKMYMETQKTQNCQVILRKKNKSRGIILPDFRQYYKATVIKMVYYGHKTDIQINGTDWRAQK